MKSIKMRAAAWGAILLFLLLCVLWPNIVHEPLHVLALRMQGLDGEITWNWAFPAHPFTTVQGTLSSVGGGLLFLLLPSVFSVVLLVALVVWRPPSAIALALCIYVSFDLIVNIVGSASPISDFRFLRVLPSYVSIAAIACAFTVGVVGTLRHLPAVVQRERTVDVDV